MENNNKKSWMEYFRLITPFMLVVVSLVGWGINGKIENIDSKIDSIDLKLFTHLTNDEIHTPRSFAVSQQSFTLYQTMRDKEMNSIKDSLVEIKDILKTKR